MERKDIEKSAEEIAERIANIAYSGGGHIGQDDLVTAFEAGVEWQKNSVWNKELEKAKTQKCIMVKFTNGLFNLFEDVFELKEIEDKVESFAYIEDLLPNED